VPKAVRVAVLVNPANATNVETTLRGVHEIIVAFASLARERLVLALRIWICSPTARLHRRSKPVRSRLSLRPEAGCGLPGRSMPRRCRLSGTPRQPFEGDLARWADDGITSVTIRKPKASPHRCRPPRPRCMPVHEAPGTRALFVAVAGGWRCDDLVGSVGLPAVRHCHPQETWPPANRFPLILLLRMQ
jgi:hypothetical protein